MNSKLKMMLLMNWTLFQMRTGLNYIKNITELLMKS